jgi:hypothetical protein
MDGGDMRYATRDVHVLTLEAGASVIGIVGAYILWSYHKTRRFTNNQLLVIMGFMVADFYATYVYFATEILSGMHNVGGFADLIVKFILANTLWMIMPWVVFVWAGRQLASRKGA